MKASDLAPCDFDDPESVVGAFIASMNGWEKFARRISRQEGSDAWAAIVESQQLVFGRYCTPKERKFGRNGSFQHPPEYDPGAERIVGCDYPDRRTAHVDTDRRAVLGGGRYRYTLYRRADKWLIDNLKSAAGPGWKAAIL